MQTALDLLRPGQTIYVPGASGESHALAEAIAGDPDRMDRIHIVSCPFPGINERDYTAFCKTTTATVFLPPAAVRGSAAAGRTTVLPFCYSQVAAYLETNAAIDIAFAHVSRPNDHGVCSLGIAVDFNPIAWANARQKVLLVNPAMPWLNRGYTLNIAEADVVVDAPGDIVTVPLAKTDLVSTSIGARVAALVPDAATIQIGLGNAPAATWEHLGGHRNLVLASGLIADGFERLFEGGAMQRGGDHRAGVILGSRTFIDYVAKSASARLAPVTETHDSATIATLSRFTAINGALEVDLFGQINLEWQGSTLVSGVGGAPDFVRGAMASAGGRSITALPSTARGGKISRIVARLTYPASLGRRDADTIVTEYGVAELRGRPFDARAEALIAVAAPEHRDALERAWSVIRTDMWKSGK